MATWECLWTAILKVNRVPTLLLIYYSVEALKSEARVKWETNYNTYTIHVYDVVSTIYVTFKA